MQDGVDCNNQDPTMDQSASRTKVANEVLLQPSSPFMQYSQQSSSDMLCTMLEPQNHGQTSLDQPETGLVALNRSLLGQSEVLTAFTRKRRVLLIIFGVGFLLYGAGAIALEILIIMYSFTHYYRGLWIGFFLIGTGISIIVNASRTSFSFLFMKHLIRCNLPILTIGVTMSMFEISVTYPCAEVTRSLSLCDSTTGRVLKLAAAGELHVALFYSLAMLSYAQAMQAKSISEPPPTNTRSP